MSDFCYNIQPNQSVAWSLIGNKCKLTCKYKWKIEWRFLCRNTCLNELLSGLCNYWSTWILPAESTWGRFFRNAELEKMVDQDLSRLYPEHGSYFQTPGCQGMLRRVLLLWCLRHPECGYRQGILHYISFPVCNLSKWLTVNELSVGNGRGYLTILAGLQHLISYSKFLVHNTWLRTGSTCLLLE